MIPYEPRYLYKPKNLIDAPTAWNGIESILHDLISRFCPDATKALEVGVDYGYSTVALSNFFASVVAVDSFEGDPYAGQRDETMYERVRESLLQYPNIRVFKADYRNFFHISAIHPVQYDLAHIDIIHNYEETLECGRMAWNVSRVVMFHDTRSFPEVMRAVTDLAAEVNANFYEWPECHGVGILTR